ncbi:MAG: helix-hairpin-helix domain-containing protein [Planctomycetes bacterium]|nr:helix-hairpin-helix domain-containing protein [Planctomycetota bacterium]
MGQSEPQELFSRLQVAVLLVLVCLFGVGLFFLKHERRLRSSTIEITAGNPEDYDFKVDVNQAPWEEISLLPGIGPVKAKAIVSYRRQIGCFRSAEDLLEVYGIGEKTVSSIAEYLVFADTSE